MAFKQFILGDTKDQDYIFEKTYGSVQFHEDGKVYKLKDLGDCMIVNACDKPSTFEKEFLYGTGLCASDFEMHYIYHADYIYIPKDKLAFDKAIEQIMENTRRSSWCVNVMFHLREANT